MSTLESAAPAFVEMAHRIVWAAVATVDSLGRPRGRILHPYWEWDGERLTGWVGTVPSPLKRAHLEHSPYVSVTYWTPSQDTCTAECHAELLIDATTRQRVWDLFTHAAAPVGYDPATVPIWADGPLGDEFAVLRLDPWRLRVFPGTVLLGRGGDIHTWAANG